jgi:N-acetylglutamate synthase-like GNAT family acetyltransferase
MSCNTLFFRVNYGKYHQFNNQTIEKQSTIFSIRKATILDLNLTFKIKKNALHEYLELLWGWNEEAQYEFHQEHFEPNNFQIIEISNEPIGYLEVHTKANSAFLANFMILKSFQGKGIGKCIVADLLKTNNSITLEVLKVNLRAKYFYENLGFTVFEEKEDVFTMLFQSKNYN